MIKRKYNLALIPVQRNLDIIEISQSCSKWANKYLLGNHSFPHVTLYHFKMTPKDLNHLWEQVQKCWDEPAILLELNNFSCVTFDKIIYSISLLPDKYEHLLKMHVKIAALLDLPVKKIFDPHITLFNTKNRDYKNIMTQLSKGYSPIKDNFVLSIGKCDGIGQFTEIIYKYSS